MPQVAAGGANTFARCSDIFRLSSVDGRSTEKPHRRKRVALKQWNLWKQTIESRCSMSWISLLKGVRSSDMTGCGLGVSWAGHPKSKPSIHHQLLGGCLEWLPHPKLLDYPNHPQQLVQTLQKDFGVTIPPHPLNPHHHPPHPDHPQESSHQLVCLGLPVVRVVKTVGILGFHPVQEGSAVIWISTWASNTSSWYWTTLAQLGP